MAYFNLFIGANIADIISTYAALNTGAGVEANPFIHNVMQTTSIPEALALKFILAAGVAVLLKTRKPRLLVIPTLVFALVAISNSLIGLSVFLTGGGWASPGCLAVNRLASLPALGPESGCGLLPG